MLKKVFMAFALFVATLTFAAQNAYAEEVEVYNDSANRLSYCVDNSTIAYTDSSKRAFKSKSFATKKLIRRNRNGATLNGKKTELLLMRLTVTERAPCVPATNRLIPFSSTAAII